MATSQFITPPSPRLWELSADVIQLEEAIAAILEDGTLDSCFTNLSHLK